jgi:hypothetical protein
MKIIKTAIGSFETATGQCFPCWRGSAKAAASFGRRSRLDDVERLLRLPGER